MPPMPKTPKPETNSSNVMSASPTRISAAPPQLTGKLPRLMKARTRKHRPREPGNDQAGTPQLHDQAQTSEGQQQEGDVRVGQDVQHPVDEAHVEPFDLHVAR